MGRTLFIKHDGHARPLKVNFEGRTLGDLKAQVGDEVNFEGTNKRIILKSSKHDLADDRAVIPEVENDVIFVTTKNAKNGSKSYAELKSDVRDIIAEQPDARSHFGQYHMLSKSSLETLIAEYRDSLTDSVQPSAETLVSGLVEDTDEMRAVRAAYENTTTAMGSLLTSLDTLGQLLGSESVFGGFTLSELNSEWTELAHTN